MLPLPNTFLFHEALLGPDNLDETGLDEWEDGPPYVGSDSEEDSAHGAATQFGSERSYMGGSSGNSGSMKLGSPKTFGIEGSRIFTSTGTV